MSAISFAAIFFRKSEGTHPLVAAGVRLAIAGILLSPMVWRAARRGMLNRFTVRTATIAGFAYAGHFGTWVSSLSMTTVAASVTLVTATPLLLAAYAIARGKDRPDRHHGLAITLAVVGVSLIGGADLFDRRALSGDALALGGAAAMAVYLVTARRLGPELDPWSFTGMACAVGAALLLTTALLTGTPIAFESSRALGYVVLAALIPQLIGHSLLTWSLRHVRPTVVGLATVGEPVGSALLGWLWLGEKVSPLAGMGCIVTIGAVALAIASPLRKPASHA